jgi:hypothetical protein
MFLKLSGVSKGLRKVPNKISLIVQIVVTRHGNLLKNLFAKRQKKSDWRDQE